MLDELDPYTVFFFLDTNEEIDIAPRGKTASPGISIGAIGGKIVVTSPEFAASGYKQGIQTGDEIVSVDGNAVADLTSSDVRNLLMGDPGSIVEVVVNRIAVPDPIEFSLTRKAIRYRSVSFSGAVANGTTTAGYIKLDRFGRGASAEVRSALDSLVSQEPGVIILDLRDNPGGLLNEAVGIVSLFVSPGQTVVSTLGRATETNQSFKTSARPLYPDGNLVVLVNEISASASEIVAGALQDLDRAVVIGSRSFGKGLVQVINNLPYNTSLKLTTARYYMPSGRSIQNVRAGRLPSSLVADSDRSRFDTGNGRSVFDGAGIDPDIEASNAQESELVQALRRKSAFFSFANELGGLGYEVSEDFEISDDIVSSFRAWLAENDFRYESGAERQITATRVALTKSGFSTDLLGNIDDKLKLEKEAQFDKQSDEIRRYLFDEVMSRYLDDSTYFRATSAADTAIIASLDLAADPNRFEQILGR
jgi:carboxyl-terminal processing protease